MAAVFASGEGGGTLVFLAGAAEEELAAVRRLGAILKVEEVLARGEMCRKLLREV